MSDGTIHYDTDTLWGWNAKEFKITHYRLHKPEVKPASNTPEPEAKPTIEQLAQDYRDAKDRAERIQQYADETKADAKAKLDELVAAGKALGLDVSPITVKQLPELVITDWRDLQEGDLIKTSAGECLVRWLVEGDESYPIRATGTGCGSLISVPAHDWRFIRRP